MLDIERSLRRVGLHRSERVYREVVFAGIVAWVTLVEALIALAVTLASVHNREHAIVSISFVWCLWTPLMVFGRRRMSRAAPSPVPTSPELLPRQELLSSKLLRFAILYALFTCAFLAYALSQRPPLAFVVAFSCGVPAMMFNDYLLARERERRAGGEVWTRAGLSTRKNTVYYAVETLMLSDRGALRLLARDSEQAQNSSAASSAVSTIPSRPSVQRPGRAPAESA